MKPFNYRSVALPVNELIPDVQKHLQGSNTLIVSAPPGAGKSTVLPLALLEEPWLAGKKILMLEPRRLAAKTIAARMAALLGEQVGQTVGYRIRFENRVGHHTRLEVLTEGILTRMLQSDNALEDVGLVIFDEFHERSLYADVALALCRYAQEILRPDLRIMVMSATLDLTKLTTLLKAPLVAGQGKLYPVATEYCGPRDLSILTEAVARIITRSLEKRSGRHPGFFAGRRGDSPMRSTIGWPVSRCGGAPLVWAIAGIAAGGSYFTRFERTQKGGAGHLYCRNQFNHRRRSHSGGLRIWPNDEV